MLPQLSHWVFEVKLAVISALGIGAILADMPGDYKSWEDVSVKVLLLIGLVFVVRLYLQQGAEHKKEMKDTWDLHKKDIEARDKLMMEALKANTEGLAVLTGLTREQTDYYKAVTRNILEEKLKGKPASTLP